MVASRSLRRALSAHVDATYIRRLPESLVPGDTTTTIDAGLDWRVGARVSLALGFHRDKRTTDAGGIPYTVNEEYVGVSYSPRHVQGF